MMPYPSIKSRRKYFLQYRVTSLNPVLFVDGAGPGFEEGAVCLSRIVPGRRIVVKRYRHSWFAVRMVHRFRISMKGVGAGVEAAHAVKEGYEACDLLG
jgi:hypothetical protein